MKNMKAGSGVDSLQIKNITACWKDILQNKDNNAIDNKTAHRCQEC